MINRSQCKKVFKSKKDILSLVKKKRLGIKLDVGCGEGKQEGFVGLDIQPLPGVDIIHDAENVPYPLPAECCSTVLASHLVEHLCPKKFVPVMNEWWRISKPGGQLWIGCPHGRSPGMLQDPTHCNFLNEATWAYFTPEHFFYKFYRPKPWKIIKNDWWESGNMEVVLEKMTAEEVAKCQQK